MLAYPLSAPSPSYRLWPVYWYGLMYLVGFWRLGFVILRLRYSFHAASRKSNSRYRFYSMLSIIVGGRLATCSFTIVPRSSITLLIAQRTENGCLP